MSQTYVNEKLDDFKKNLDETERKSGVYFISRVNDAEKYLSLSPDELASMSLGDCIKARYATSQHALCIQRTINRSNAIKSWASRNLDIVISKDVVYDGTFFKYEVRRDQIISNNSYAKALNDIIIKSQSEIDILYGISQSIKEVSQSISNAIFIRKGESLVNN